MPIKVHNGTLCTPNCNQQVDIALDLANVSCWHTNPRGTHEKIKTQSRHTLTLKEGSEQNQSGKTHPGPGIIHSQLRCQ